jgi:hypothetical protein
VVLSLLPSFNTSSGTVPQSRFEYRKGHDVSAVMRPSWGGWNTAKKCGKKKEIERRDKKTEAIKELHIN